MKMLFLYQQTQTNSSDLLELFPFTKGEIEGQKMRLPRCARNDRTIDTPFDPSTSSGQAGSGRTGWGELAGTIEIGCPLEYDPHTV